MNTKHLKTYVKREIGNEVTKKVYYCHNCHKSISISTGIDQGTMFIFGDIDSCNIIPKHYFDGLVYCKDCNNFMTDIDGKIFPYVYKLNTKGIQTMDSCEGHYFSKRKYSMGLIEAPYLVLSIPNEYRNIPYNIAKEFNKDNLIITIEEIESEDNYYEAFGVRVEDDTIFRLGVVPCAELKDKIKIIPKKEFNKIQSTFFKYLKEICEALPKQN